MKEKSNATLRRAASLRCCTDTAIGRLGRAVACYQRGAITTAELLEEASGGIEMLISIRFRPAPLPSAAPPRSIPKRGNSSQTRSLPLSAVG